MTGTCKEPKTVFVTSGSWHGDLGGIAGADMKCSSAASAEGLAGSYKAWLSTQDYSPASQAQAIEEPATSWAALAALDPPFKLTDGTLIANSWADLTDGTLANAINIMETGVAIPGGTTTYVWTATNADGTFHPRPTDPNGYDCEDWTSVVVSAGADMGYMGSASSATSTWTDWTSLNCGNPFSRLYCFQQ